MLVVIGTDCIGSFKSNYHTMTIMMASGFEGVVDLFEYVIKQTEASFV
jgi:hypothetical protein